MNDEHTPYTDEELQKRLTPEEYAVLRQGGTEAPFSGDLLHVDTDGTFTCKVCGSKLFEADAKFDSGTGWPSFDTAIPGAVKLISDDSLGMRRTEVTCATCGSHLGHVFDDGPTQTGKRYCINSVCLGLDEK